jgi:hypothetical protein
LSVAYRLFGDIDIAASLRGEARRLLFILTERLNNLQIDTGTLARSYPDGSTIRVTRNALGFDIMEITAGAGGGKQAVKSKTWLIFLFYTPTKFKLYTLSTGKGGTTLLERSSLPANFPLPYTWYSSYANVGKDPTPAVISNRSQSYHFINTVVDPLLSPAGNGYDDWHYHSLYFSPGGWWDDGARRESPTAFPTLNKVHFSISPYTAYPLTAIIFREGGILQPLRQYSAETSLYPLSKGTVIVETEIANALPGDYGRKGYTFDVATGTYAASWKERVNISGIAAPTVVSNQGVPWLGWFLFPWTPYLHEISAFQILPSGVDQNGSEYVQPGIASPATYALNFINSLGAQILNAFLSEQATFNYNGGQYSTSSTNSQGTLISVKGGGPFGNLIWSGAWIDWQDPNKHNTGPFDYVITNLANQSIAASGSGTFFTPIGSVGNQKILKIQNDFTLSQLWQLANSDTCEKSTTLPWQYYFWWSGIEEYWMPDGDYTDNTSGTMNYSTSEGRTLTITQKLMFMDQILETLFSTLTYSYANTQKGSGSFSWTFHNTSNLPLSISGSYSSSPGSAQVTQNVSATAQRNIQAVEVLDFDSHPNGNFIVIYKKITIAHTQNNAATASGANAPQGPTREAERFPWPAVGAPAESFQVTGTRKVEYFLFWQNAAGKGERVKLAEFNSTVSGNGSNLIHTATGQRIYGVTCQVSRNMIAYHYLLETYSGTPSAPAYDSPMNFEDYSYQGNVRQWTPAGIVVGCVPDTTSVTSRVQKSFAAEPNALIYSIGMHQGSEIEEEVL